MITVAAGVGMMVFLGLLESHNPVYLVGLIPVLVGIALLVYAFGILPKPGNEGRGDSAPL